jgi:hypothetical protein
MYGAEANVGSPYTIKTGSIQVLENKTEYDLNSLWANVSESGAAIEIRKVYHDNVPAIARYFDPFAGTGMGTYSMLQEFGFTGYSTGVSFLLMPLHADILRFQAIELNDMVRRSAFSFRTYNNKLKITPIPTYDYKLYFEYILINDRDQAVSGSVAGSVSDYSNAPYYNIQYQFINDVGKQWIRKYTLALAKELLGAIREKYNEIPIPDATISLDGAALRSEAQVEKDALVTQLRENLEELSRVKQLEYKKNESDYHQDMLKHIPLKLYVG